MTQQERRDTEGTIGPIGERGLLVHMGRDYADGYSYFPDDRTESWREYRVELVEFAAAVDVRAADITVLVHSGAPAAILEAKNPPGSHVVLVNLNAFRHLQSPTQPGHAGHATFHDDKTYFLIHEEKSYYLVTGRQLKRLNPIEAGEPKILVRRGALVAAVPTPDTDVPFGTHCVLVNLTQLA